MGVSPARVAWRLLVARDREGFEVARGEGLVPSSRDRESHLLQLRVVPVDEASGASPPVALLIQPRNVALEERKARASGMIAVSECGHGRWGRAWMGGAALLGLCVLRNAPSPTSPTDGCRWKSRRFGVSSSLVHVAVVEKMSKQYQDLPCWYRIGQIHSFAQYNCVAFLEFVGLSNGLGLPTPKTAPSQNCLTSKPSPAHHATGFG